MKQEEIIHDEIGTGIAITIIIKRIFTHREDNIHLSIREMSKTY